MEIKDVDVDATIDALIDAAEAANTGKKLDLDPMWEKQVIETLVAILAKEGGAAKAAPRMATTFRSRLAKWRSGLPPCHLCGKPAPITALPTTTTGRPPKWCRACWNKHTKATR